jgi:3-oxoacyl-(acyl-carrier-protein) synthase
VAITGLGVLSGYGRGTEALWAGLSSGRSAAREHSASFAGKLWVEYRMASLPVATGDLAGELPNQAFVESEKLDRDTDLVVIADSVRQALDDAGPPSRVSSAGVKPREPG